MKIRRIPFRRAPQLSKTDVAYADGDLALRSFYKYDVTLDAFKSAIEDKKHDATDRAVLVNVLRTQYSNLKRIPEVDAQLDILAHDNTFTVATAHQPCLFTGPLYYIYKIFSTIHLADQLNRTYPAYHFVPVFVSGAEDHDFDEINSVHLFNKTITWNNEAHGAVGNMSTASLKPALEALRSILGESEHAANAYALIEQAYTSHAQYGDATVDLLHSLFGEYGLIVADMNTAGFKRLFVSIMEQELIEQPSKALVETAQAQLEAAGFSGQAYAREINLFYLKDHFRERIVQEGGLYKVLNTDFVFTRESILAELHQHPERFSPNVVMRPLYQEKVLPNLAYIGGGGEIAYWLERKEQFRHFGINFPMLVRRNSVCWIDEAGGKRLEKLGLEPEDLFEETEALIKRFVASNTSYEISLDAEKSQVQTIFDSVLRKAAHIDSTLEKAVLAEQAKQINALEHLEAKLMRAEKQKQDTTVQQIRSLREKYFPGNGLQERRDNFLPLYVKHGKALFDTLRAELDPLTKGFIIIQS